MSYNHLKPGGGLSPSKRISAEKQELEEARVQTEVQHDTKHINWCVMSPQSATLSSLNVCDCFSEWIYSRGALQLLFVVLDALQTRVHNVIWQSNTNFQSVEASKTREMVTAAASRWPRLTVGDV